MTLLSLFVDDKGRGDKGFNFDLKQKED